MCPKQIIIYSLSHHFLTQLSNELHHIPSVRFHHYHMNGLDTIVIKCVNYYEKVSSTTYSSFYGSYLYLYTTLSLLLSEKIISFYEKYILTRSLKANYFYFSEKEQQQIKNIASAILDPNFPVEASQNLYQYRKRTILNLLLQNFRQKNYLYVDAFVNFSLRDYQAEIDSVADKSVELFLSNHPYMDIIQLLLHGWSID